MRSAATVGGGRSRRRQPVGRGPQRARRAHRCPATSRPPGTQVARRASRRARAHRELDRVEHGRRRRARAEVQRGASSVRARVGRRRATELSARRAEARPVDLVTRRCTRELDELARRPRRASSGVRVDTRPTQKVLARVADVPGFGWRALDARAARRRRPSSPTARSLDNGLRRRRGRRHDGTLSINGHGRARPARRRRRRRRHLQLVPAGRRRRSTRRTRSPSRSSRPARCGPGSRITRRYRWPERTTAAPAVDVDVRTDARAPGRRATRAGARRARQPLPRPPAPGAPSRSPSRPTSSLAECAFAIVERGLDRRGRAHRDRACPRSRRAASCRPAGSPSPTRACSSTSSSTSTTAARTRSRSRSPAAPGCSRRARWPPPPAGRPDHRRWRARSSRSAIRAHVRHPRRRHRPVRVGGRPAPPACW